MSEKVTIKTLFNVLDEIERGARDTSRTADCITDLQVRGIINTATGIAVASGLAKGIAVVAGAGALSVATGTAIGLAAGAKGAAVGTAVGTAVPTALGLTFAAKGAAAGSIVPGIGTAIGALAGIGAGIFIGRKMKEKANNEKQRLYQEVMAKQNGSIKQLKTEKEELEKEVNRTKQQNERYKYLIGVLMSFKDIEEACAA